MSDVRPLSFRRLAQSATDTSLARPRWLAPRSATIHPAPFSASADEREANEHGHSAHEAEPSAADTTLLKAPPFSPEHAPRRSSFPPRKSVPPPQVVISRFPPPPVPADARLSPEQEAFAAAALDVASLRARILSGVESELLELAVHIAQAIIEREVQLDPSLHKTFARTAVLALGDTQHARLRVSRAAYRAISELYGEAAIDVDGVRVEVSMDASFDALSVVAEAGPSRVDARVSERLAAVLRAMEAEHRRNNAENASMDSP